MEDINTINDDITKILDKYAAAESEKSKADEDFKNLRQKITKGSTTGDRIRDFCIVHHNTLDRSVEEPYRQTYDKISKNIGQEVLMVTQVDSIVGCPGIIAPLYIDPMFLRVKTEYKLGVISDNLTFDMLMGGILIPLKQTKYVENSDRYNDITWSEHKGNINIFFLEMKNLGKKLEKKVTPMRNDSNDDMREGLRIYAGDEVARYFGDNYYLKELYNSGLELLNK